MCVLISSRLLFSLNPTLNIHIGCNTTWWHRVSEEQTWENSLLALGSFKLITFPPLVSSPAFSLFPFLKFLQIRLSLQSSKPFAICSNLNFRVSNLSLLVPYSQSLYLSNIVSFDKARDLSSVSSSLTSTSLSLMSSKMVELLKTLYVEGDTATSFYPPSPIGASQRKRRLLADDKVEEEKERRTLPYPLRLASQAATETLIGGAPISRAKGIAYVEAEAEVAFGEHSLNVMERRSPCRLDYSKSTIT